MEKKRNTWSEEETIFFLGLLKEKKILQVLDGKRFKATEVYKALEEEMLKNGYKKDANMMKTKFKNLKADYYKVRKHNSQSGENPRYCPYFEMLDELLGDCPTVAMDGIDTSLTHLVEQESGKEDNGQEEETIEYLQTTEDESSREMQIPEGHFEMSDDGYLSPATALPEGIPSTFDDRTTLSRPLSSGSEHPKTPKKYKNVTHRNPTAILFEVKESIQESLKKKSEKEEKEDEFLEKLLKGQSQLLKEMTDNFIEGIASLFKRRKRKYYSSSTDSECEEEKRKRKK